LTSTLRSHLWRHDLWHTPGLVAHVIEEQTNERPMRRMDPRITAMTDQRPNHFRHSFVLKISFDEKN